MGSSTEGLPAAPGTAEADPEPRRTGSLLRRLFARAGDPIRDDPPAAGPPPPPVMVERDLPGLANLRRLRVDDVAVPKVDIVAAPHDITRDGLVALFREHGFSRIPVYRETMDDSQGVVTLKDFALNCGFGAAPEQFDLQKLLRPLLYAPPSMPLHVLLHKMQAERSHMALMIDEYGGVDGLVTIEDLLETVVGNISDEHDTAEHEPLVAEADGCWLVQATADLDDVEAGIGRALRAADDDPDIDTIGGLVSARAGRVPAPGEVIRHGDGVEYEILAAEPHRIRRLRLRLPPDDRSAAATMA